MNILIFQPADMVAKICGYLEEIRRIYNIQMNIVEAKSFGEACDLLADNDVVIVDFESREGQRLVSPSINTEETNVVATGTADPSTLTILRPPNFRYIVLPKFDFWEFRNAVLGFCPTSRLVASRLVCS